jgi:hypothetical protein
MMRAGAGRVEMEEVGRNAGRETAKKRGEKKEGERERERERDTRSLNHYPPPALGGGEWNAGDGDNDADQLMPCSSCSAGCGVRTHDSYGPGCFIQDPVDVRTRVEKHSGLCTQVHKPNTQVVPGPKWTQRRNPVLWAREKAGGRGDRDRKTVKDGMEAELYCGTDCTDCAECCSCS